MKSIKVVISKYKEDVSWTKDLRHEFIIFNKNVEDNPHYQNNLPNFGREGHTFINYIVENYDNLPDYNVFLQGNPFDHCPKVIDIVNNFDFKTDFLPLGNLYTYELNLTYNSIDEQMKKFAEEIGFDLRFPVTMVPGAQYIIHKSIIMRNPIDIYKKIRESLDHELYPQSVLDLEKTLFQLYGIYEV